MSTEEPIQLFNERAEESVIGSVLVSPSYLSSLDLEPDHFFIQRYGLVWKALRRLQSKDIAIDFTLVLDELDRMGKLEFVGGPAEITKIIRRTATSIHVEDYAEIVKDYSRRRKWMAQASKIAKLAGNLDADLEVEASGIIDKLLDAVRAPGAAVHWSEFVDEVYSEAHAMFQNPQEVWGIQTHFLDFDDITGGLQTSEMLELSGEAGIGKSKMAAQMGYQMASGAAMGQMRNGNGIPGVIYSLEMIGKSVARRLLTAQAQVPTRNIKTGKVRDDQWTKFVAAVETSRDIPLYMSDSAQWTTASLQADLSRLKAQQGIKWFVLDYAYLMRDGERLSENDKTGLVSSRLKAICRSLNLAGIIILSMNKDGDIRSNAQQKYDADLILTLHDDTSRPGFITCMFKKGRELDKPKVAFDLIATQGFPMYRDPVSRSAIGNNGRAVYP